MLQTEIYKDINTFSVAKQVVVVVVPIWSPKEEHGQNTFKPQVLNWYISSIRQFCCIRVTNIFFKPFKLSSLLIILWLIYFSELTKKPWSHCSAHLGCLICTKFFILSICADHYAHEKHSSAVMNYQFIIQY